MVIMFFFVGGGVMGILQSCGERSGAKGVLGFGKPRHRGE